jgi:hypothetical protein
MGLSIFHPKSGSVQKEILVTPARRAIPDRKVRLEIADRTVNPDRVVSGAIPVNPVRKGIPAPKASRENRGLMGIPAPKARQVPRGNPVQKVNQEPLGRKANREIRDCKDQKVSKAPGVSKVREVRGEIRERLD